MFKLGSSLESRVTVERLEKTRGGHTAQPNFDYPGHKLTFSFFLALAFIPCLFILVARIVHQTAQQTLWPTPIHFAPTPSESP